MNETPPPYPVIILPHSSYRLTMDVEALHALNATLQRKCPAEASLDELCENGNLNKVSSAAFGNKGLQHMSVNLMGGLFSICDADWHQTGNGNNNWTNGNDVDIEEMTECYEYRPCSHAVYFPMQKTHLTQWTFPRTFPDQATFDSQRNRIISDLSDKSFRKDSQYDMGAKAECKHAPTLLNYWHIEIDTIILSIPEELVEKDKGYRKKALHGLVDTLRLSATLRVPENPTFTKIPEDVFLRS